MSPLPIEIVSTYYPAGMSWLLNALIELDVGCYKGDAPEDLWSARDEGFLIRPDWQILQKHCPSVTAQRQFAFQRYRWIRWAHDWPSQRHDQSKIIFFVRDPRDTLFSQYKRANYGGSFEDFLEEPLDPLPFTNKTYFQVYHELWGRYLEGRPHLLLRFEDVKTNPRLELKKTLDFLGLNGVGPGDLDRAIEASTFQSAKKGEAALPTDVSARFQFQANRAGIPLEYKKSFTPAMLFAVGAAFDPYSQRFGYESQQKAVETCAADPQSQQAIAQYIFACIEKIDTQPALSANAKEILANILQATRLQQDFWPVVSGKELLPAKQQDLETPSFAMLQKMFLWMAMQQKLAPTLQNPARAFATSLLRMAPSQTMREFFIHRWMVMTGDYIGP